MAVKPISTKFGWRPSAPKPDPIGSGLVRHREPDEKVFPDNDKIAVQLSLKDETDKRVSRAIAYRGFIAKERMPHYHWVVFSTIGSDCLPGADIPFELQGTYTGQKSLQRAIDEYLNPQQPNQEDATDTN